MENRETEDYSNRGGWVKVAVAWLLVGVPLLWGVFMTLKKAAQLFR